MGEPTVGRSSVPMFYAGRDVDGIAGQEFHRGLAPFLIITASSHTDEGLSAAFGGLMYVPVVAAARFEGHIDHGNTVLHDRGKIALAREIPGVCVVGLSHREEDGLCIGFDRTCGHAFGIPIFCPVPLRETVAIGCGFGYYSLSAILLNELAGADIGTIALICNLSRELLTLLTIPLLARYCGKLAPITAAGATSIDTTLPLISATLGEKYVIFAIFHGIIVDISVPVLIWLLYL